jgi:hypothetical protein
MMLQMIHVWDHFDHTNDIAWWKAQGWPLLKVDLDVSSLHRQFPTLLHLGSGEFPSRQAHTRSLFQRLNASRQSL